MNNRNIFIISLLLIAAALRVSGILPMNFSPVAAIALFGGAMLGNRLAAFAAPLVIMLLSDLLIGLHDTMWAVYLSLVLVVGIGQLLRSRPGMLNAMVGAVAGSVLFFIITNAAVWINGGMYAPGIAGLFESYAAGLPFFRNSLMGDLFFTVALFGTYQLAKSRFPQLVRVRA
ncbi:MAG: hypothetical protein K9J06_13950 [Flavobacteriales bacterium]|nr:hypothetical protein [Flavobacteriales bacterium]